MADSSVAAAEAAPVYYSGVAGSEYVGYGTVDGSLMGVVDANWIGGAGGDESET